VINPHSLLDHTPDSPKTKDKIVRRKEKKGRLERKGGYDSLQAANMIKKN